MVRCKGRSEKLTWSHVALMCGHLETPDRDGGTDKRKVSEKEEKKWDQPEGGRRDTGVLQ